MNELVEVKNSIKDKTLNYKKRENNNLNQRIIQLDRNENTIGCSKNAMEYVANHLEDISIYTDVFATSLRIKLAQLHKIKTEQILVGNGSFELISLISSVFLNPNDEVIYPSPSFEWYKTSAYVSGAVVVEVPLIEHKISLEEIEKHITGKTKIIWICNPNNPTGTTLSEKELREFIKRVPSHILVVIDEAYLDFVRENKIPSLLKEIGTHKNLILLRTFSKAYGLASLRVGYAIADETIINQIIPYKIPPNTNRLGILAAEKSLEDEAFYHYVINQIKEQANVIYDALNELGLTYIPSDTNFIFFDLHQESEPIVEALAKKGVLVRGGKEYGYPDWIRVTIGTEEENAIFIEALSDVLDKS